MFCWHVCSPHVCPVPLRSEESIRPSGTGVPNGCEPPCWCWELSSGPLQEQPDSSAEPLLQPGILFLFMQCVCTGAWGAEVTGGHELPKWLVGTDSSSLGEQETLQLRRQVSTQDSHSLKAEEEEARRVVMHTFNPST